jgi:hypothetical protein
MAEPTNRTSVTILGASIVTIMQVLIQLGWLPAESIGQTTEAVESGAEIIQALAGLAAVWGLRRAANDNIKGLLRVGD